MIAILASVCLLLSILVSAQRVGLRRAFKEIDQVRRGVGAAHRHRGIDQGSISEINTKLGGVMLRANVDHPKRIGALEAQQAALDASFKSLNERVSGWVGAINKLQGDYKREFATVFAETKSARDRLDEHNMRLHQQAGLIAKRGLKKPKRSLLARLVSAVGFPQERV